MHRMLLTLLLVLPLASGEATSPWSSEEHWLVDTTVRQIVRWAVPAGQEPTVSIKPAAEAGAWIVHLGGADSRTVNLSLAHQQWSALDYLPLAQPLLPAAGAKEPDAGAERRLLERLLAPATPVLLAEDARISARLAESLADPGAHE